MPEILSLKDLRHTAKTGDCLLLKGKSILSKVIMMFTEYSHAAMVIKMPYENKVFVVEATWPEVELRAIDKKLNECDEAYLFQPSYVPELSRSCVFKSSMDCVATGIKYDLKSLIKNIVSYVSIDAHKYFCSEFVWDVWVKCGIAPNWFINAPRPGDIPKRIKGRLYKIIVD